MLNFVTGGSFQGKTRFAHSLGLPVVDDLHLMVKEWLERETDIEEALKALIEGQSCTIVCKELGCGIIPADEKERSYREAAGRAACYTAQKAEAVYRVEAGIATRIK